MTKSIFSLLLFLVSFTGFAQPLDSVMIDNEWRYVYPVNERINFDNYYYSNFGLTQEEFLVWVQWKAAKDSRADLKTDDLKQAIQRERYNRKDVNDSVYNKKRKDYGYGGYKRMHSKKDYRKNPRMLYSINERELAFVPPVVRNLPDGKYVQFFETYATFDKRSKSKVIERKVAAKFELSNNDLNNKFERFTPDEMLLVSGMFDHGLKTGEWFEMTDYDISPFKYKGECEFWDKTSSANYETGVKNGKCYNYDAGFLDNIYNYKNGDVFGEVVEISGADSIVYDIFVNYDPYVNYASLATIRGDINQNFDLLADKKNLEDWDYMERIQPELFTSRHNLSPIRTKNYPDSVLLNRKPYPLLGRQLQDFETYYKIYDRKTKKVIFQCFLDTVSKFYSGSSWYPNGQKFDTIWTDPVTMDVDRIIYDTNGVILFNSLKGDFNDEIKFIDGFAATPYYSSDRKLRYYYYEVSKAEGDTVFRKIHWDINGKMTSNEYFLRADSSDYSIVYFGEDFNEFKGNHERKLITYFENGIKLTAFIPLNGGEPSLDITVNGQAYEGPIEIRQNDDEKTKISMKNGRLLLNYAYSNNNNGIENGNVSYDQSSARYSNIKLVRTILMNFEDGDLGIKCLQSVFKNHQLEGKTLFEDYHNDKFELNYSNGLPNGQVLVYKKRYKYYSDLYRHNEVDPSCHFRERRFHKKYISKSYTFKNGLLDGPMVFYTTAGDTTGVIPFQNGLKNGKVFQYRPSSKVYAEFRNDTLTNKLELYTVNYLNNKYDTLWYISFDNSGNLVTGKYKFTTYRSKLMMTVDMRERFKRLENGIIESESSENDIVYERELIDNYLVTKRDMVQSGEVKYSEEFTEKAKPKAYFGGFSVIQGMDDGDKGIVWNRESRKKHNFQFTVYSFGYDYDIKYSRYIKKYFSNGVVLREGPYAMTGKYQETKSGVWKVNDYNGRKLYEINYHDSLMKIGTEEYFTIGIQTEFDSLGNVTATRAVLSEEETYECSSDDYYAERQYITLNSNIPSRMNGMTKNYYDNGALMNEGKLENGIPQGLWKFYTPDGKLTRLGSYQNGKENGKWLYGDLAEKAYIGEVCIDPNDPEYEFTLHQLETDKDVEVVVFKNGKEISSSSYSTTRYSRSRGIIEPQF